MDAREIYGKFRFARLMVWAGVREDFNEPAEEVMTKAFCRIVAIDKRRWIEFLLEVVPRLIREGDTGEVFEEDGGVGGVRKKYILILY